MSKWVLECIGTCVLYKWVKSSWILGYLLGYFRDWWDLGGTEQHCSVEEVLMKWMDKPSVTEMERGGVYKMGKQKKCQNVTEMGEEKNTSAFYYLSKIYFF